MAEIKDKIVTVESLAAVHAYNQGAYMTQTNPSGNGTFSMNGNGNFSGNINVDTLIMGNTILRYDSAEGALKVSFVANEIEEIVEEVTEEIIEEEIEE